MSAVCNLKAQAPGSPEGEVILKLSLAEDNQKRQLNTTGFPIGGKRVQERLMIGK